MIQNDTIANLVEKIPSNDNGQAEESEIEALKERIVILEAETSGDPRILQKEGNLKDRKPRKPLNCEECDQEFSRNCDLEKHLESHDKQKDFKCEKTFFLKWRLQKHQEVHLVLLVKLDESFSIKNVSTIFASLSMKLKDQKLPLK